MLLHSVIPFRSVPPTSPCRTAMEYACRSRPTTAAADDEENGRLRRFPEPPLSQPHGRGDANTSGVDAALLTRRQELLLELHKGFMHQDMIWRELMETERAMGLTAGGYNCNPVSALPWSQDYSRRWMPSVPSWEVTLRQPRPCGHESSTAVKAPPVYPHVEQSLHAPEQTRLGNDAEQHQDDMSSRVRIKQFDGYFEFCHSPSKQTPVAAKAGTNQMQPSSGHQQAIVGEKFGVEYVQNMQASHEIKNQSSEGRKAIEDCTKKSLQQRIGYFNFMDQENAANNEQNSTQFNKHAPEQTRPGNDAMQHQEGTSSGVRIQQSDDYFELCYSPSKQTPVAAKAGINQMRPSSRHQQAGVEYVQNMQPSHEIKNQSSEGWKAIDSAIDHSIKKPMQLRLQYKPAYQENAANNDQKSTEFNKPTPEGTSAGLKRKLAAPSSPVKKQQTYAHQDVKEEVPENRWTCRLCQAKCTSESDYHSHLGGRRHRENEEARRARFYCKVCDVQCNSEKNLESHLGGRRHRETVEGSDSD